MDVYMRVTSFVATLKRDLTTLRNTRHRMFHGSGLDMERCNILIVTHGLTLRLFLMRFFRLGVEEFEDTMNPPNGCLICMNRHTSKVYGWEYYRLESESARLLNWKGDVSTECPAYWRGESEEEDKW